MSITYIHHTSTILTNLQNVVLSLIEDFHIYKLSAQQGLLYLGLCVCLSVCSATPHFTNEQSAINK